MLQAAPVQLACTWVLYVADRAAGRVDAFAAGTIVMDLFAHVGVFSRASTYGKMEQ
jgi:hypothetical protein